MIDSLLHAIVYFSSGLILFRAFAQLLATRRHVLNILNFISLLCLGLIPLQMLLFLVEPELKWPIFYFLHTTSLYALGPSMYCYLMLNTMRWNTMNAGGFLHFVPAFAVFIYEIVIQLLPGSLNLAVITEMKAIDLCGSANPFMIIRFLGLLHIILYFIMYLYRFFQYFSNHKMLLVNRVSLCSIIYGFAVLAIIILHHIVESQILAKTGIALSSLLNITWFLLSYRVPEFMTMSRGPVTKKHYERSRIENIDGDEIQRRLRILMEEEKAFCDEDITLGSVAEELSITIHQLSEFLNSRLQMSFKTLINTYRVEEARKLIREEPGRSILSIAYAVGFNSRSNFNRVFHKFTGETPSDFKERQL